MMLEKLAPKVFKERKNKLIAIFASEAYTNGGKPAIKLYKDPAATKRVE